MAPKRTPTPSPVHVDPAPARVKVRAIAPGYTAEQKYVRPGDVFLINVEPRNPKTGEPAEFSSKWQEYVDPQTPEKITSHGEALNQQRHEILTEKARAHGGTTDNPLDAE